MLTALYNTLPKSAAAAEDVICRIVHFMLTALYNTLPKSDAAAVEASEREDTARKAAVHFQKVLHDFNQPVVLTKTDTG